LLPGLVAAAAYNVARGQSDVALFEIGRVFLALSSTPSESSVLPHELEAIAGVLTGFERRAPVEPDRAVDVYDAVGFVRALADGLGVGGLRFEAEVVPGFDPKASARVFVGDAGVGVVGALGPAAAAASGVDAAVAFELDLDALTRASRVDRQFRPPSTFPPSAIDLAFVVGDDVWAAQVIATLHDVAGEPLESVHCFDEFRSEQLGEGRRSLAFALRFRAPDRTLTDVEIGELRRRCIDAVVTTHGAELRG
jgi:phenylalanyl-tRNA synthetase beta chain